MNEYEQFIATKRKRKAPDRLEVSFDSEKSYGSTAATISADGRMIIESSSGRDDQYSFNITASSSSKANGNNSGQNNSTAKYYDIESLKKSYRFEKNFLPDGDRDMNMDKVFYYEHETPFAPFIEESSNPISEEEAMETNLYVIKNFSTSTIQVGLYGPINPNAANNEYYMMPQSPTDIMEKWDLDMLVDTFLLGGKLPIKVEFSLSTGGNKRKKTFIGFVFSLERNEDGHIVCYSDRNRICIQRVLPLNMKIIDICDTDRDTILLMERELRKNQVLL